MTLAEQIKAAIAARLVHVERMKALATLTAGDGTSANPARNLTDAEQKDFDTAEAAVKAADAQIARLKSLEQIEAAGAAPAPSPAPTPAPAPAPAPEPTQERAPQPTAPVSILMPQTFKGQGFVRMVSAIMAAQGNIQNAALLAEQRYADMPQLGVLLKTMAQTAQMPAEVLRAAVAAGTTSNSTWAAPLVYAQNLTSEFIDLLRPQTILGRLPFRTVPFNVSIPRQTAGAAAGWVGEGLSKPVQKLDFDRLAIPWAKIAVIAVITQELARFSNPAAETLIRDDLIAAIGQFKDVQLIDPTVTASAGVRPASITNNVTPVADPADITIAAIDGALVQMLMNMNANNIGMTSPRWIMNGSLRILLENLRTTQDLPAYPEVARGLLKGYPIVESNNVPIATGGDPDTTMLILVDASQILHAEDPVIDIAMSTEASLQLDSAPATPPTPVVSLFQQNLMAIKAEQYEYWVRRRDAAVQYIAAFPLGTTA